MTRILLKITRAARGEVLKSPSKAREAVQAPGQDFAIYPREAYYAVAAKVTHGLHAGWRLSDAHQRNNTRPGNLSTSDDGRL